MRPSRIEREAQAAASKATKAANKKAVADTAEREAAAETAQCTATKPAAKPAAEPATISQLEAAHWSDTVYQQMWEDEFKNRDAQGLLPLWKKDDPSDDATVAAKQHVKELRRGFGEFFIMQIVLATLTYLLASLGLGMKVRYIRYIHYIRCIRYICYIRYIRTCSLRSAWA